MDNGKLVICVLAGAAVGTLLGVLFAPDKGSETRKKISGKSLDSVDDIRNKLADLIGTSYQEEASDFYEKGRKGASDYTSGIKAGMR
ncbi:MAG: YtxH domain-containing protein [Bacteroidota bacterium]|nr:YtxH domain-containing protein [Bacteroidota bacterium]